MKITPLAIPEVLLIEPEIYHDNRGFFFESFNQKKFSQQTGLDCTFVQDNQSSSFGGVLRGLHFQLPPASQGKLIRVIEGEIFDVAVDLRLNSPTFGQSVSAILSTDNKKQMWIPEGFAHGFLTLSKNSQCIYKTTSYYEPELECCLAWDDKALAINWPLPQISQLQLSDKDKSGLSLSAITTLLKNHTQQ